MVAIISRNNVEETEMYDDYLEIDQKQKEKVVSLFKF